MTSLSIFSRAAGATPLRCLPYLLSLTLALACQKGEVAADQAVPFSRPQPTMPPPAAAPEQARFVQVQSRAAFAAAQIAQKLIRTGDLRIQVEDIRKSIQAADSIAKQRGAVLADSRMNEDEQNRHHAQLVIRVPADRFGETIVALRRLGDVKGEAVNTQDVTREYADLETRLAVKEQTVARLRSLLENRTAKLSDVLEVERELARTVTELEQLKGERRFYDQQIALSVITVSLFEPVASRASQLTEPIGSAFRGSLEVLGKSVAGVIYGIIFVLPWAILMALVWWAMKTLRVRVPRWRGPGPRTITAPDVSDEA